MITAASNLGNCYHDLGRHEEAHERYREAIGMAEKVSNPLLKSAGQIELGRSLYRLGRLDEAREPLVEARSLAAAHGFPLEAFHSGFYLWRIALERRVGPEAIELFRELKQLRLRVDQQSEEISSFDAYLGEVSTRRKRQKQARQAPLSQPARPQRAVKPSTVG